MIQEIATSLVIYTYTYTERESKIRDNCMEKETAFYDPYLFLHWWVAILSGKLLGEGEV